jgi:hypothetical protein
MGMIINRKTKGKVKLTRPIAIILNEWLLDFDTVASMASGLLKDEIIRERNLLRKILVSNELHIIDVINLSLIVEQNITKLTLPTSVLNQFGSIFGSQSMTNANNSLASEAKLVKKFIDKHYVLSLQP